MKIEKVLENLEGLLSSWGISTEDWIFAAQYAERLLGYNISVRKGHLNLLVSKSKIPWKVKEEFETHPLVGTKYSRQYQIFMKKTGFEFDIVPVSLKEFEKKIKKTVSHPILPGKQIQVQIPWGGALKS